jgi:hypothetical protein
MDYSRAMSFVQCVGYLYRVAQHLISSERTFDQPSGERFAFDELHHQMIETVLMPNVVKRADVRMVETRHCSGFTFESLPQFRVCGHMIGQNFNRDDSIQASVASAIDLSHPARAKRGEDFVGPKSRSRGDRYSLSPVVRASVSASPA